MGRHSNLAPYPGMIPITETRLRQDILGALIRPYGLQVQDMRFLRYSQNHVYACHHQGKEAILRISQGRHRTKQQIEAELAWINLLVSHRIRACQPIPAKDGAACVALDLDGKHYIAACFGHVPGNPITQQDLGDELYEKLGRLLGQLHAATSANAVPRLASSRPHWYESRLLQEDRAQLGTLLTRRFCDSVDDLIRQLRQLPVCSEDYALIHGDFSLGNCFLDGQDLWIFDFDNCEQGHFVQDLVTVLYDSIYCKVLNGFADAGLNDRITAFWRPFWRGYAITGSAKVLNPVQLKQFFLLREAIIYMHYHRVLDLRTVSESFVAGLEVMRSNVENQEHQVDFEMLALLNSTE